MNQNQQTPPSAGTPTTPATSSNMNSNAPSQASRIMTNSLTLPNSHHHASLSSSSPLQNSSNLATMNSSPSSVKSSSLSPLAVAQPSSIATTFISTNNNNNNRPVSTPVIPPFNQTSMKYSNHPSSIMVETTTHDDKKDDTMTTNSPCMRISLPSTPSSSLFTTPTTTCSFSSNGFSPSSISTDNALVPMTTSLFSNTPLPVAAGTLPVQVATRTCMASSSTLAEKKVKKKETKKKKSKEDDDQDTKKRKKKSSDSVDIKKESTPKKKKKKQADQPQEPLNPSSSPTAMEISKSKDALSNTEMMKQIYFGKIPKQLTLRICCLMDGETEVDKDIVSEENGNILIDGNKFLNELIEWKGALDDSKKFFRFHAAFVLTAMSPDDITSFADLVDSMKEALQSCECSEGLYDLRRDTKIYNETLEYQYNTESSTIQIIMKRKSFIEEIATIIYKMVSRQEEEEMEEVIEQETQVKETTEELTLIFTFSLENNPKKKYNIELKTPKSTNYKKVICENLRLFENDIQKYTEEQKDETTIYASGILPKSFMNALAGRVDVNVVHRHVFYEQRVISHTLYERMKSIIGQTNFEQFNHLCFLVCTPDQNTLWYQTMERLERANILPPNTKLTSVSIKYRKDHLPIFEAFRNRIEKEQDTLFIVIADECHFAITKDGAHDNIVNDALALKHNNFFVLLVSATPYNVISVDSNVPEVYELKQQILKDTGVSISKGTKVKVINTEFREAGFGYLIRPHLGNHNGVENIELIYDKEEYLQQVKVLTGKIGDFSVDDIVHYDESNHMLISHTSDKQLQIELSTREKKKINYSKNIFKLKKPIGNLQVADKSFVEIFDTVKWMVTFCPVDNPSLQVSMNDWEFRKYTEYEEYNVICWHDVQKRTILERTAQDFQTKRYFSKQDYINSIKSGEDLVLKDVEFESILRNVKAASITLRPIMLAIDYHFWFIFQAVDHKLCTTSEAFNHFLSIDTISTTDEHKLYVSLCKLLYLFYMAQKYGGLKKVEKVFENEYLDDEDNVFEEKKTKKQKKQDLKSGLKLMNEKLKKTFERKKKKVKESFEKMMSVRVSGNSHTGKLVHDLLESGKINGSKSISGQMKILRITTTEFANTVVSMLKFSVTKLASLSGYILPDVLIDTGEKPLTLDQLSVVTRLKLAEKILSTEDYELFQKNPARLSKEKKSLEYINLQNFPCILILVAKGRQGDTFPQSFDCLDMRAKGDSLPNYSSFTQEFGRLCRYIDDTDKKPIALVTDAIYKDLDKCKNGTSMGNTNMKLDAYMIKMKKTSGQKYWTMVTHCRRTMQAVDGKKVKGDKAVPPSYDCGRAPKQDISQKQCHQNRLVLFAEPQIGKTDSFLHFLERVIKGIEENRMKRMIDVPDAGEQVEEDETLIVDSVQRDQIEWTLPYHYSCQNTPPSYESLTPGKYGKLVLKTRSDIYEEYKHNPHEMIHMLSRVESSLLSSAIHWDKLLALIRRIEGQVAIDRYKFQTFDGRYHDLLKSVASYNILKMGKSSSTTKRNITQSSSHPLVISSKNNGLADMSYTRAVNIVQHTEIYEFDMPSILDDIFPKVKPKMSIPNNKKHWFRFSDPQKICGVTSLADPNDIRSWIFMPSYNRSACGLFYLNSILNAHYRQVVVVRSQEFNCYRDLIGSDFVIMSLPDVIDLKKLTSLCNKKEIISRSAQYTNNVEDKTIVDYELKDDIGGAGFSRLTIQILAYAMQLEFVWMMDDNCHHFEKVTNTQKTPCSLEEVLLPIESIVYDEAQPLKNFTQTLNGKVSRNDPTQLLTLNDPVKYFTPGKEKIAMIGIRKDAYRYNPGLHYKPFLNSTTICSLFLLNVKVTFDHGILFPCRKYQEDIEFEYLCAEKGLYCIKSQKYFLHKPSNPLRIESNANKPCMYACESNVVEQLLLNYRQAKPQPQPLSQEYQLLRNAISTGIDWTDGPGKFSNLMTSENDIGKEFWLFLTNDYLIRYNKTITNAPEILEQQYPELLFDVTYFTPQKENIQELIIRLVIRRK